MKIKVKNPKNSSMQLIVPVDGLITVDANGVADVSTKCAVVLVTNTNDWEYAKKTTTASTELDEKDNDKKRDKDELNEREELEEKLKGMKLEEMKAMAKEGGLPEKEWGKLTSKKLMFVYLLKKYDEVSEEEEEEDDDEEEK